MTGVSGAGIPRLRARIAIKSTQKEGKNGGDAWTQVVGRTEAMKGHECDIRRFGQCWKRFE